MQHLLDGDAGQQLLPAADRCGLLGCQALIGIGLEAEAGIQVLAHDQVLDLRRLGKQVPKMLAVLDNNRGLGH